MSLTFAEKDPAVVLAEALAIYETETGITLAPADPRRLHLQALVLIAAQLRAAIDFSGKQNLLRYVSSLYIEAYAELWGLSPIPAGPSVVTLRFTASTPGVLTIPAGKRATNGMNTWAVVSATTSEAGASYVDAVAHCTVNGAGTNGVAAGQIDTLVDTIPGIASVSNTTATISGRDVETTEQLRERIRDAPESTSTAGPRAAYRALSLAASTAVADVAVLGPRDADYVSYDAPTAGEVHILVIEGERDDEGTVTSVIPDPTDGLLTTVDEALSAEDVRPLGDYVNVSAPVFVDFEVVATYYISRDRSESAAEIQEAVEAAFDAYLLWQQSKVGRDINPSSLIGRLYAAGAKRVVVTEPAFESLLRDQAARLSGYGTLTHGGVEDE